MRLEELSSVCPRRLASLNLALHGPLAHPDLLGFQASTFSC